MDDHRQFGTACCVLCAAALGLALTGDAAASTDGAAGATSSGSVQIRVSVAQGGALTGLASLTGGSSGSDPVCLWLNTGTSAYALSAQGPGSSAHQLVWTAGAKSVTLRPDETTPLFQAARRPGCRKGEQARLEVRRVASHESAEPTTLLIKPE